MLDSLALVLRWLCTLCRLRGDLALRQQLSVLSRRHPRPRLTSVDRFFWVMLRRTWLGWTDALIVVKPDTVMGWHRAGFRLYWRFRSRVKKQVGRPRTGQETRNLIQRMAAENPSWGAPRIHGELLKLGVAVSERTVSRCLQDQPRRVENDVARVRAEPSRSDRRHRPFHGADGVIPTALRVLRDQPRAPPGSPR